ncbi:DUF6122 family protein [Sphingobacterium deserti]|uniref:DUF6122 family protein n=1 Tax=Sphingobacterium deserti TaxID=1229276 RepID=UPI0005698210|nr:DUF6122 family protein [Sphingobacterium deserti]
MGTLSIIQTIIHYGLHFVAPGAIAYLFYRERWRFAWLILLSTMLVDLDHLLADPIFDPNRCSVGFHLLHSYPAIIIYAVAFLFSQRSSLLQLITLGLLFHMLTDVIDCQLGEWL